MKRVVRAVFAAAVVAVGFALGASAASWTTSTWSTFTAAEGNIIKGKTPSAGAVSRSESTADASVLTDGEGVTGVEKAKVATIGNNGFLTYTFDYPSRVDEVRLYTVAWGGRRKITVTKVSVTDEFGSSHDVGGGVDYNGGTRNFAALKEDGGAALCACATTLTIQFGAQENNYVGYTEIEIIGAACNYYRVQASPSGFALPTPREGLHAFASGETLDLSTPAGPFDDESRSRTVTCTGYDIAYADGTVQSGTGSSVSLTPSQAFTITWKYDVVDKPGLDPIEKRFIGSYVQEGLVGLWDGIYNQGVDAAHSSTAAEWKDLSGNGNDLVQHVPSGKPAVALPVWGDSYAEWTGASGGQAFALFTGEGGKLAANTNVTLEILGECSSFGGNNVGLFVMPKADNMFGYMGVAFAGRFALSTIYYSTGSGQWGSEWKTSKQTSAPGSFSVASVGDGKKIRLYYRGEPKLVSGDVLSSQTCKDLVLGYGTGDFGAGLVCKMYGVRLYDRALTAGELLHNYMVDQVRHFGAYPGDTAIRVAGKPQTFGTPIPSYGVVAGTVGSAKRLSVVDTLKTYADGARAVLLDETSRAVYEGYEVTAEGVTLASGTEEETTYVTRQTAPGATTLAWKWRLEWATEMVASGIDGAKVEIVGKVDASAELSTWLADGVPVTIRAIVPDEARFTGWTGDTAGIADLTAAETTFIPSRGARITAAFVSAHHDPTTVTLKTGASGSWDDPANWTGGEPPQKGDTVIMVSDAATSLTIGVPTAPLAKLVVSNVTEGATTTISCANWGTCIRAEEIVIGRGGVIKSAGGFYENEMSNRVWLATGALTVERGGTIDADRAGWAPGNGPSRVNSRGGSAGGAYGGQSGDNFSGYAAFSANSAQPYGSVEWPFDPGSGPNSSNDGYLSSNLAKSGGGAIYLDVTGGPVRIDGTVSACGAQGDSSISASSGGGIVIVCSTIEGDGVVTASALDQYSASNGGSGGRLAVHYDAAAQAAKDATCRIAFRAKGGYQCAAKEDYMLRMGGPGSLWFTDNRFLTSAGYADGWKFSGVWHSGEGLTAFEEDERDVILVDDQLFFDDCGLETFVCKSITASGTYGRTRGLVFSNTVVSVKGDVLLAGASIKASGGSFSVDGDLLLAESATAYQGGELWLMAMPVAAPEVFGVSCAVAGQLQVPANATVVLKCDSRGGAIPRIATGDFLLSAGGKVDAKGWGYGAPGRGPGASSGAGATHAGRGASTIDRSRLIYGNEKNPLTPGSSMDVSGGGVVYIVAAGKMLLDGVIDASGKSGGTAAGAGGSVNLSAERLLESHGSVSAAGGTSTYAGGGGRIAIRYGVGDHTTITFDVRGGTCSQPYPAGEGTFYSKIRKGLMLIVR